MDLSNENFDYIIIGAGSAGCVLAEGLSRSPKTKVLVIEAGGSDNRFWIKVPLGYGMTFSDPRVTWAYHTQNEASLNHRSSYWPRGRVWGGSSSINAMAYVRGLPHDYDDWGSAGAKGWSWSEVRPVFEKMETQITGNRKIGDGPVIVSDMSEHMHQFSQNFFAAGEELGWARVDDINQTEGDRLGFYRSTIKNGRRWSASDAFLKPALKRPNLKILSNARVERVAIEDKKAVGVYVRLGEKTKLIRANAEVILSAGAIGSPQILQLSGIGDPTALKPMGIDVVHALAEVGNGLQDHLAITHHYYATDKTLNSTLGHVLGQWLSGVNYVFRKRGPLCVPTNQVGGFVRSQGELPFENMQIYCNPISYQTRPDGMPQITRDAGFILCAQPCRPTSRGKVHITANDPNLAPLIQPNSLDTQHDQDEAIYAGRMVEKLANTSTIKRLTKSPKMPKQPPKSDAEMLDDFRARAYTNFHPSCTCKMGSSARDSVLDGRLKVHGLDGLRVVDASAFPNITSGNTNAPTLMLAARAVGFIIDDAKK